MKLAELDMQLPETALLQINSPKYLVASQMY